MKEQQDNKLFLQLDMHHDDGDYRGVPIIVFEVFFRASMGERYYDFHAFKGGLYLLLFIRFCFILGKDFSLGYPWHPLDGVLALYLILTLWHWMQMRLLKKNAQEVHSYFIGYSRLFFIGKILTFPFQLFMRNSDKPRFFNPYYFTYVVVDSLTLLAIGAFGYLYWHSVVIGLVCLAGAVLMCYNNFRKVRIARLRYINRKDEVVFSRSVQSTLDRANQRQKNDSRSSTKETVSPRPITNPSSLPKAKPIGNVMENAYENLPPQLKNLGKKR